MIAGIDLGTTNSLISVWKDGKSVIIPNALGSNLTPSVVGLDDNGDILVGEAARERLLTHPDRTVSVFKRFMGSRKEYMLGNRTFRPEELSALVLRSLLEDAKSFLGEEIPEAVISVPAYFNDTQRKATKNAGLLADIKVERMVNEPTAAALAYGLQNVDESKYLILDLGGGTFDVSLLEFFEGIMEVKATAGDNYLGGEDFVEILVQGFLRATFQKESADVKEIPRSLSRQIRNQAEGLKLELSRQSFATMEIKKDGKIYSWQVTHDEFEKMAQPLLARIKKPILRVLKDTKIDLSELDKIVLVGGATRMPVIKKLVAKLFGRLPTCQINPDEAVALGAAVQAGLKARDSALDEVVLTDVSPYTLGTGVAEMQGNLSSVGGFFLPIIERNTTIPVSRVQTVCTVHNNQKNVVVDVYQGERPMVKDNVKIGEFKMSVPPAPAGREVIELRFTYDLNGILEVEATLVSNQNKIRRVFEENPGTLTREEIEERLSRLSDLKIHPRETIENRTLLARGDRLFEENLELREQIRGQLAHFVAALENQEPGRIDKARSLFSEYLDSIENGFCGEC